MSTQNGIIRIPVSDRGF